MRWYSSSRLLRGALLLGFALACTPLRADLAVEAPESLRELLLTHLPADADGERLKAEAADLLATEGYFSATIEAVTSDQGTLLRIDPGVQARVAQVRIEFEGHIAGDSPEAAGRRRDLESAWGLAEGTPFRDARWRRAKQELLQRLTGEDYAAGRIADSQADVDAQTGEVRLLLRVDSGPPFTLGALQIAGLERYPPELVRRYSSLEEGERYRRERLLELQSALQNAPYFASVVVEVETDPSRSDRVPVQVRVLERRTKRVGLSVGYSSNTGYRGEVSFQHRDLLDRGWLLESGVRLEQTRRFVYGDVFLPPTSKDYRDSFGALHEHEDTQGLTTARYAVAAVRTRTRGRIETRTALTVQRERRSVAGAAEDEYTTTVAPNWSWTYRNLDNPVDPRDGDLWNFQVGGGAKAVLSDQNFVRLYGRVQWFLPVGERDVVIVRGEAGIVGAPSRNGVPESFLFRTGGAQSVRGYAYNSLGVDEQGAVVGGRRLLVASAEYVHWLAATPDWGGAVFYDVGDAGDTLADFVLHAAYGAGVRWRSPVGPLALDIAYGQREARWRPSLSVSIAF